MRYALHAGIMASFPYPKSPREKLSVCKVAQIYFRDSLSHFVDSLIVIHTFSFQNSQSMYGTVAPNLSSHWVCYCARYQMMYTYLYRILMPMLTLFFGGAVSQIGNSQITGHCIAHPEMANSHLADQLMAVDKIKG